MENHSKECCNLSWPYFKSQDKRFERKWSGRFLKHFLCSWYFIYDWIFILNEWEEVERTSTTGSSFIRRASATWWRDTCHDYDTMESSLMEQDYSSFVELSWVGKILWWTTKEYSIFIHSISFFLAVLYKYLRDKCMLHLCTWYFQKSIFKTFCHHLFRSHVGKFNAVVFIVQYMDG